MTEASDTFTFETGDGFLAYRDTGTGRPLVLLHGGFVDHTMWDDQVPALARHHRVIAPDARGHGASANATAPFRQTDDLAALLHRLDVGPAVLVGLSMGAITAVDTALEHPALVAGLVLGGGGAPEFDFTDPWAEEVAAAQFGALATGDIEGWMNAFLRWAAGPQRALGDVRPDILQRLGAMAGRTLAKHTAGEPDHHKPVPGTSKRAGEIAVPVLALNGALDAPELAALARHFADAVTGGRTVTVEGAGHFPNMEQPDAYNRAVAEFAAAVYAGKG